MEIVKSKDGNGLNIVKGDSITEYYYFWLRDHCRCKACYNHVTSQRKISVADIPAEIKANDCQIEGDTLKIVCKYF